MSSTRTKIVLSSAVALASVNAAWSFQPAFRTKTTTTTSLNMVAVDPTVVTKKEYEDICGVGFDDETLHQRLKATNFLYPKHVEVIEDIAPIAGEMVDSVVSVTKVNFCVWLLCEKFSYC